jgi:hypothetical protein
MTKTDAEASQKVDKDTIEQLDQVKKGKPRKFVMICKGASVITLVVYKRGSVEKYKKEAKKAGKGQIYYGKVDGKGMDITFQLAVSDGFDKEPVKPSILRTFLEESADFKCKPSFEIVEVSTVVLDEDDPLVIQFRKLQKLANDRQSILATTGADAKARTLCRQIEGYFDEDQVDNAKQRIFELESVLNVESPTTGTTSQEDDLEVEFTNRIKELAPKIEKAGDNKEIVLLGKLARELAGKKDFRQALKALDKLVEKLQYAGTVGEDKAATVTKGVFDRRALLDSVKEWQKAKQIVDQQVNQLLAALRTADLKVLQKVAKDCDAVGAGFKPYDAALVTAIQKTTQAAGNPEGKKAAEVARQVVAKYQKHIEGNRLIQACEDNPLNVEVAVRINLGLALAHLDKSLGAAVQSLSA